jgi:hypothetical protein
MLTPLESLVKYDNAVQVSTAHDKKKGAKKVSMLLQRASCERTYCAL